MQLISCFAVSLNQPEQMLSVRLAGAAQLRGPAGGRGQAHHQEAQLQDLHASKTAAGGILKYQTEQEKSISETDRGRDARGHCPTQSQRDASVSALLKQKWGVLVKGSVQRWSAVGGGVHRPPRLRPIKALRRR